MKVIHLIGGGDVGGAKTHVLSLIEQLQKEIPVRLVCFRAGKFADDARALGIDTVVMPAPFSHLPALARMVRRGGYDLIHCHGSKANVVAALLKPLVHLPVVTTVHSDYRHDYMGRPLRQTLFGTANAVALRALDWYIPVAGHLGRAMVERGFNPQRLCAVYNGMDYKKTPPPCDRRAYFRRFGFPVGDGDVVIGFAGRLTAVKDLPTMLRAFAKARVQLPCLKLFIAGEGEDAERLKALARSLGVAADVCFAGWIDNTAETFSAVDINVLTSKSEGFPYVLLEGAAYRRATVASRVGGIPDLILHGETGLLFEPGDIDTLSSYFVKLGRDAGLRDALGGALYERAVGQFSIESMKNAQMAVYGRMLREKSLPRRRGVVICGAYGKGNAGDEAILEAIVTEMREINPEMPLCILSRRPKITRLDHRVRALYTFDLPGMIRAFRRASLYVNGGGSLIQDITSSRSLYFYLLTLALGKLCGCRVMMYGCGIGPVRHVLNRRLSAGVLNRRVDTITLREDESVRELADMGVTRPRIVPAADPAMTLSPAPDELVDEAFAEAGIPADGEYLCLCMRSWPGFEKVAAAVAAAADYAYEQYGLVPVLLPIEMPGDGEAGALVAAQMRHAPLRFTRRYSSAVTIGVMARMRAVLAMRLHALVFAASRGVPIAGIVYDKKIPGFMHYMGQTLCADMEALDAGVLRGFIDRLAATPKGALRADADRLRAMEGRNAAEARALLPGEAGESYGAGRIQ